MRGISWWIYLICDWVRDLMVPMHLGLDWWALCAPLVQLHSLPNNNWNEDFVVSWAKDYVAVLWLLYCASSIVFFLVVLNDMGLIWWWCTSVHLNNMRPDKWIAGMIVCMCAHIGAAFAQWNEYVKYMVKRNWLNLYRLLKRTVYYPKLHVLALT
jgi:hypothetical protein